MFGQHRSMSFLLFLLSVQCLCCSCQRHSKTVTIVARITDPSGSPISGAYMIASDTARDRDKALQMSAPLVAYPDRSSRCTIDKLPPGNYRLIFVGDPFRTRVETYQLEAGTTLEVSARLRSDAEVLASNCPARSVTAKLPKDLSSIKIVLRRGRCEGTCPAYTLTLYGNGRVDYDGEMYVAVAGHQSYRVEESAILNLLGRFYDIGFFGFCDQNEDTATDQATVETTLQVAGTTKTVSVYGNSAPDGLKNLDAKIDEIAGVSRFLRPPTAPSTTPDNDIRGNLEVLRRNMGDFRQTRHVDVTPLKPWYAKPLLCCSGSVGYGFVGRQVRIPSVDILVLIGLGHGVIRMRVPATGGKSASKL